MKQYLIYKHTNKTNGKVYIGQTCKVPEKRWESGGGYVGCPYFYQAIKKYGWDGFTHEILLTGLSQSEADEAEERLIAEYDSVNPKKGYNLKSGGLSNIPNEETRNKISVSHMGAGNPNYGKRLSEETIRKRTESYLNGHHHHSEESRKKISESHMGAKNPMYGKKLSKETREKMSLSKMGTKNHNARKVKCYELNRIWGCVSDCARELNLTASNIVGVCRGRHETTGGYHFEYTE